MTTNKNKIQVTKFIPAVEEKVFSALTNPNTIEKWFCPEGMKAKVDEWEPKVGGILQISLSDGEDEYVSSGKFLEVIPFHKMVFTYGWAEEEADQIETIVTIELRNLDDGTDVHLTQEGIDLDEAEDLKVGWLSALSNLAKIFN